MKHFNKPEADSSTFILLRHTICPIAFPTDFDIFNDTVIHRSSHFPVLALQYPILLAISLNQPAVFPLAILIVCTTLALLAVLMVGCGLVVFIVVTRCCRRKCVPKNLRYEQLS